MSNAIFNKAGTPTKVISLPTHTVLALLSSAIDTVEEGETASGCYIISKIGGVRSDNLADSADEAMAAINSARASKRGLLKFGAKPTNHIRLTVGDDGTYLLPEHILGYEEVSEDRLRVFWQVSEENPASNVDINNTIENRQAIDAITQGE